MMPLLLASFLFLLLMGVISAYGYRAYVRPARIYDRVGGVAETSADSDTVAVKPRQRLGEFHLDDASGGELAGCVSLGSVRVERWGCCRQRHATAS